MFRSSTSNSRSTRYVLGFVAVCVLAVSAYVGAFLATAGAPPVRGDHYWTAYFIREKERLASAEPGKRILLFGTSSTFFGINAARIQEVTGIPTFNMATHAGNGVAYTLSEARKVSRAGDIAVILIDASVWIASDPVRQNAVLSSHGVDNSFFLLSPLREKLNVVADFSISELLTANNRRNLPYQRGQGGYWAFPTNANGDMVVPDFDPLRFDQVVQKIGRSGFAHLEDLSYFHNRLENRAPYSIASYFDKLSRGARLASIDADNGALAIDSQLALKKAGVEVYFAIPPSIYTPDQRFRNDLIKVAGSEEAVLPIRPALPLELMYDTDLHANRSGAELATAELVIALCGRIGETCDEKKLDQTRLAADGYRAIPPFPKMTGFGDYRQYTSDGASFIGLGSTGVRASFEAFAPQGCRNRLEFTARAVAPARRVVFKVDGKRTENHLYDLGKFESIEVPLPADGKMHTIGLELLGVPKAGAKDAYLIRQIKRIYGCP